MSYEELKETDMYKQAEEVVICVNGDDIEFTENELYKYGNIDVCFVIGTGHIGKKLLVDLLVPEQMLCKLF